MADQDRTPPTDKSLGQIVGEIAQKASLLVRQEIELAKLELQEKAIRIGKGVAVGAAAGVFVVLALIFFLQALSYFFTDLFNWEGSEWGGFLVTTVLLLLLGALAGFLAYRFVRGGVPPTPDRAIEEAKRTRAAIEEVRR